MTYCPLMKIVNGYLPKVRSHHNSGLVFYKKLMLKCMEDTIKLCREKIIKFLPSSQTDFHMKSSSNSTRKILSDCGTN